MKFLKRFIKISILKIKLGKKNKIESFNTISLTSIINRSVLGKGVIVAGHASINNSTISKYSAIGRYSKITHTQIGKFCAISWDCTINALKHPQNHLTISAFPYVPEVGGFAAKRIQGYDRVIIGNDVWIGAQVIIMPGLKIGHGSIIGAGSVVTKDVPDYAVMAGVPAKILKYRFDEKTILDLLNIQWWDWPDSKIKNLLHLFKVSVDEKLIKELKENN